ncbi:MAG TPA: hypothetical protein VFV99_17200 [Kofleriaceae bacterium]|nr:hypothetical protein [Kofleriaceae bacterium]
MSLCIASTAWAGKPLVDAGHFADESQLFLQLGNTDSGYWLSVQAYAVGFVEKDRARIEVRQGGKQQFSYACQVGWDGGLAKVSCDGPQSGKLLKKAGPVEVDLIQESDADDKEYLLRTFKVNAKNWDGKREWQIDGDDLLGAAYFAPTHAQTGEYATLRFWVANGADFNAILRCTIDGKSVPDIDGTVESKNSLTADIIKGNSRTTWHWTQAAFYATRFKITSVGKDPESVYVAEHPGSWQCQLRKGGITVREFSFKTNAKGDAEPHPMQQGKGAPPLPPRVAMVDVKIPKDNGLDQRIKPDVIKKSRGFGLAWPQHDSVKVLLASLPPAYENANPPPPKKGPVKLVNGLEANPPKLVDESSTTVSVWRNGNGYFPRAKATIAGTTQAPSNMYRLEWKQGAKLLATLKCSWQQSDNRKQDWNTVECEDNNLSLTAKGAIEANLIYTDDQQGVDYLVRTYKVTVAKYPSKGDPVWQVVPDDVLATAWAHQGGESVKIRFWLGMDNTSVELRCTVDGKKLPDIKMSGHADDNNIEATVYDNKANATKYVWQQAGGGGTDVQVGMPPKDFKPSDGIVQYLGQYPGKWDCIVRQNGKQLREVLFTVNNKGSIDADPNQPGVYPSWVVPIELRFGKDILDGRVRPDAMKKSRGFGLPWPKPPTTKFPAASGLPDPK